MKQTRTIAKIPGGLACVAGFGFAQTPGTFTATGPMSTPRVSHTATLLNDGRVLITGGVVDERTRQITDSAELYDPANGTFTPAGRMTTPRADHSATLLPNGKILIAGGVSYYIGAALTAVELYDPSGGTFTPTGNMTIGRSRHSSTLLNNGQVLITGGYSNGVGAQRSAELYDPNDRQLYAY